jgi:RNA polymerase sigma-70 factor (ECF subfamily)
MQDLSRNRRIEKELVHHIPHIRRFARRFVKSTADLDDLVQEVVLRALANLDKFQEGTNLKSWLFTITRNTFCSIYQQKRRVVYGLDETWTKHASIEAPQEWNLHLDDFQRALSELPAHSREALDIIILQGSSYDDAASRTGCPVGTVKSRVNRARQMLVDRLS